MSKCGHSCTACPYIKEGRHIKIDTKSTWIINKHHTCEDSNIVYLLECDIDTCRKRYIGETRYAMKFRLSQHRGYIVNKNLNQATGEHFNLPGHTVANMKFTLLEKVKKYSQKNREKYVIRKCNTFYNGLNKTQ